MKSEPLQAPMVAVARTSPHKSRTSWKKRLISSTADISSHHSPLSTHQVSKMFSSTIVAALSFAALVVATPYDAMAPGTLSSLVRRDTGQVLVSCSAPGSSSGSAFPKSCLCPTDLNGDDGVLINFFPVSHHRRPERHELTFCVRATNAPTRAAPAPGRTSLARSRTRTRPTARRWHRAPRPAAPARSTTTWTRVFSSTSSRATSARTPVALAPGTASVHGSIADRLTVLTFLADWRSHEHSADELPDAGGVCRSEQVKGMAAWG
jgi:hypothetical protein